MDQIHVALCKAHPIIQWFAFGEAVQLAQRIYDVCVLYPKDKYNKEVQKQLLEVANKTQNFLSCHGGPPNREESYKELSQALLKHQIG